MNRREFLLRSVSAAALIAASPLTLVMGRAAKAATLEPGVLSFKIVVPGTKEWMSYYGWLPAGETSVRDYIVRRFLGSFESYRFEYIRHEPGKHTYRPTAHMIRR